MEIKFDLTLESMIENLSQCKFSDFYFVAWADVHGNNLDSCLNGLYWHICIKLSQLADQNSTPLEKDLLENLHFKLIEGPKYAQAESKIKDSIGEETLPYLQEIKLLLSYKRSLDVALMMMYSFSTQNCPVKNKEKLHSDNFDLDRQITILENVIQWFRKNPNEDKIIMNDDVKGRLAVLYRRIVSLDDFYRQGLAGNLKILRHTGDVLDESAYRVVLINHLNVVFRTPEKRKEYRSLKNS